MMVNAKDKKSPNEKEYFSPNNQDTPHLPE
jgi:hypothetical protein